MADVVKTGNESDNPSKADNGPFRAAYTRFKLVPITRRIIGGAILGVAVIGVAATLLPHMKERLKFFTDAAFAWLVFVVVVVQSYIYRFQTDIMNTSLRVGSQSYVCVRDIRLDLSDDRIFIEIENLGQVPAYSVEVHVWLRLQVPPEQGEDPTHQGAFRFGKKTALFSGNLPISIRIPHTDWLKPKHVGFIKSGAGLLVVEGVIAFRDEFFPRTPRTTHFAFAYRLDDKKFFPQRILSPEELEERKAKEST